MNPDMVREEREAARAAYWIAKQRPLTGPAVITGGPPSEIALEKPAAKKGIHLKRRSAAKKAQAPFRAAERPPKRGITRGVARFLAYAIAGATLGLVIGNVALALINLPPHYAPVVVFSSIACCAFLCTLISILRR